jgi:hypothetical protein
MPWDARQRVGSATSGYHKRAARARKGEAVVKGFEDKGSAIGRFIEECGEALAAAGKTIRFGWQSRNPIPDASPIPLDLRETNEDWLRREINDLEVAIARLRKSRGWPAPRSEGPKP